MKLTHYTELWSYVDKVINGGKPLFVNNSMLQNFAISFVFALVLDYFIHASYKFCTNRDLIDDTVKFIKNLFKIKEKK